MSTIDVSNAITCSIKSLLFVTSPTIGKSVCVDIIERNPARTKSLLSARTIPILFRLILNKNT